MTDNPEGDKNKAVVRAIDEVMAENEVLKAKLAVQEKRAEGENLFTCFVWRI